MAEAVTRSQAVQCVGCHASDPQDGRILFCLHVACCQCLRDFLTSKGAVECVQCQTITTPPDGVELIRFLPHSKRYLRSLVASGSWDHHSQEHDPRRPVYCDFCDEMNPSTATHLCLECGQAALCAKDAESHTRKRLYRTHTVRPLGSLVEHSPQAGEACLIHTDSLLTSYCLSCEALLCPRCLLKGHSSCSMSSIQEAAAECRRKLKSAIASVAIQPGAHGSTLGTNLTAPIISCIDDALDCISRSLDEMTSNAESVSADITATFEEVEVILLRQKDEMLHYADRLHWHSQVPMEKNRIELESLRAEYSATLQVVEALTESTSSDVDLLKLSTSPLPYIKDLSAKISRHVVRMEQPKLSARVNEVALTATKLHVSDVIHVSADGITSNDQHASVSSEAVSSNFPVQLTAMCSGSSPTEALPKFAYCGETFPVKMNLPPPTALLKAPSGEVREVKLPAHSRVASVTIPVHVRNAGTHTFSACFPGGTMVTREIIAVEPATLSKSLEAAVQGENSTVSYGNTLLVLFLLCLLAL